MGKGSADEQRMGKLETIETLFLKAAGVSVWA